MKKLEELKKEKEEIINEIASLEETDMIKKYKKLKERKLFLLKEIYELHEKEKMKEYKNCNHVLISTTYSTKMSPVCYACIKCGLNAKYKFYNVFEQSEEGIMHRYLIRHGIKGTIIDRTCDLDLARLIYSKLKEKGLALDDDMLIMNFTYVLDNINKENSIDDVIKLLLK